jgi:hypothetical protein
MFIYQSINRMLKTCIMSGATSATDAENKLRRHRHHECPGPSSAGAFRISQMSEQFVVSMYPQRLSANK